MKTAFMVMTAFMWIGTAHALPFLTDTHKGKPHSKEISGCTNFTGEFRGVCRHEGRTMRDTLHIEQEGCEVLRVNGMEIPFGSHLRFTCMHPKTSTRAAGVTSKSGTVNWNSDRTAISIVGAKVCQEFLDPSKLDVRAVTGEIRLDGSKLLFSMRGAEAKEIATCEYERQ